MRLRSQGERTVFSRNGNTPQPTRSVHYDHNPVALQDSIITNKMMTKITAAATSPAEQDLMIVATAFAVMARVLARAATARRSGARAPMATTAPTARPARRARRARAARARRRKRATSTTAATAKKARKTDFSLVDSNVQNTLEFAMHSVYVNTYFFPQCKSRL